MTHDYKRNGTATLFAAMNTFDGSVIRMCDDRHRPQEWLKFLRVIDQVTPGGKEIHLIADNYATHKHPKVQKWLARHRRFHVYFTPTSSSWLNMVERFFRDITGNRIRRGTFRDVEELITAIGDYIDKHNDTPKPFIWTAKASDILEKVKRARQALDNRCRTTLAPRPVSGATSVVWAFFAHVDNFSVGRDPFGVRFSFGSSRPSRS